MGNISGGAVLLSSGASPQLPIRVVSNAFDKSSVLDPHGGNDSFTFAATFPLNSTTTNPEKALSHSAGISDVVVNGISCTPIWGPGTALDYLDPTKPTPTGSLSAQRSASLRDCFSFTSPSPPPIPDPGSPGGEPPVPAPSESTGSESAGSRDGSDGPAIPGDGNPVFSPAMAPTPESTFEDWMNFTMAMAPMIAAAPDVGGVASVASVSDPEGGLGLGSGVWAAPAPSPALQPPARMCVVNFCCGEPGPLGLQPPPRPLPVSPSPPSASPASVPVPAPAGLGLLGPDLASSDVLSGSSPLSAPQVPSFAHVSTLPKSRVMMY